jgi:hypothetical protein
MDNKYHFTASSAQDVTSYLWIFGDGTTEAGTAPAPPQLISAVHQYNNGIDEALNVRLVVNNTCGTDTAMRMVPTGIDDLTGHYDIKIYPNPASEKLYISALNVEVDEVQIFDVQGKLLLKSGVDGNKITVDISGLSSGLYMVRITSSTEIYTRMVQVVK